MNKCKNKMRDVKKIAKMMENWYSSIWACYTYKHECDSVLVGLQGKNEPYLLTNHLLGFYCIHWTVSRENVVGPVELTLPEMKHRDIVWLNVGREFFISRIIILGHFTHMIDSIRAYSIEI